MSHLPPFLFLWFSQRYVVQESAPAAKLGRAQVQWQRVLAGHLEIPSPRLEALFSFLSFFEAEHGSRVKKVPDFQGNLHWPPRGALDPIARKSGALHPWKKEERRCSFRHRLLGFLCQLPFALARVTKGTNRFLWGPGTLMCLFLDCPKY